MTNPHIEEAYRLLAGEAYRIDAHIPQKMAHFCTIAQDLRRIDAAISARGSTPFAKMADTIEAVFVEIIAAREADE